MNLDPMVTLVEFGWVYHFYVRFQYFLLLAVVTNFNLDGHPKMRWGSIVGRMCPTIVLTIAWTNFLNFLKMKLVKVLNKCNVACMVANTTCTTTFGSANYLNTLLQLFTSKSLSFIDNNDCGYRHLVFLLHLMKELLITTWEGARSPHEKA